MFFLGFISVYLLYGYFFIEKKDTDYLISEYNAALSEYLHSKKEETGEKEFNPPEDPDFWNLLEN